MVCGAGVKEPARTTASVAHWRYTAPACCLGPTFSRASSSFQPLIRAGMRYALLLALLLFPAALAQTSCPLTPSQVNPFIPPTSALLPACANAPGTGCPDSCLCVLGNAARVAQVRPLKSASHSLTRLEGCCKPIRDVLDKGPVAGLRVAVALRLLRPRPCYKRPAASRRLLVHPRQRACLSARATEPHASPGAAAQPARRRGPAGRSANRRLLGGADIHPLRRLRLSAGGGKAQPQCRRLLRPLTR